jgi:hypothetical protein
MQISADHIAYKKKIGTVGKQPVIELATTGGLHLVVVAKADGEVETLGAGPHRAVARHIAKKRKPEMKITELSKGDHVPEEAFRHLLPEYEQLTDRCNKA